jgi:hypothetical protein
MRRLTWKSTFQEPLDLPDPVSLAEGKRRGQAESVD